MTPEQEDKLDALIVDVRDVRLAVGDVANALLKHLQGHPPNEPIEMRPRSDSSVSIRAAGMRVGLRGPQAFNMLLVVLAAVGLGAVGWLIHASVPRAAADTQTHQEGK